MNMSNFIRYISVFVLICFAGVLSSQDNSDLSGWRKKTLVIKDDRPFRLDSLTVIPDQIEVFDADTGKKRTNGDFTFEYGRFIWLGKPLPDTIDIRYKVLAVDLDAKTLRLDTNYIKVDIMAPEGYVYDPFGNPNANKDILDLEGVEYSGSFSRGISFGNSQNLVLNSNFNLQMSGNLGDDIEILAAISDQNIPLQPEGNTQNIQDFDRVFIQISRKGSKLIAGDYDLRRPPGYFMNYSKKLQGARFENKTSLLGGEWKNSASFAISGGKFARQNLPTTEGNQGPYKLRGNHNELFIIVLSGTERVFLDGVLLERGELNDYVIDYNRGEISFTANRLITKDSRIIIEFEYTDQNFLRFMYTLGSEYQKGKWSGRFNFYNEQDSKNSGQQDLTENQIQFLVDAGDELINASASGIDTLEEFTTERIAYKRIDTLVNGILYPQVLVYSTDPDSAKYTARFSEVGLNNGNYLPLTSAANGRVYVWVAPDPVTGIPQGNFEPVVSLIAPQKKQLMTFGGRYEWKDESFLDIEGALGNQDKNRFSRIDSEDDKGTALKVNFKNTYFFNKRELDENPDKKGNKSDWKLSSFVDYEFKQQHFNALSPYRQAEFSRDWNIDNTISRNEHLGKIGFKLDRKKWGSVGYDFNLFLQDSIYNGYQQKFIANLNRNGLKAIVRGSFLNTETLSEKTVFSRPNFRVSQSMKKAKGLTFGIFGEREKNKRSETLSDELKNNSFYFDIGGAFLELMNAEKISFSTTYKRRWDYVPVSEEFINSAIADEVNLTGKWKPSKISNLKWNMTYRKLDVKDSLITFQEDLETYLGRIEHTLNLFNGAVQSTTLYEIGSGQEPELEFSYQKVNDGEGVYAWIDRNLDSIPQLDEFEEAVFQDQADYVRVSTFTNNYIRSNLVEFSNSLNIRPKAVWFKEEKNIKAFISKLSLRSSIKINRKVRQNKDVSQWNPFEFNVPDTSLVTLGSVYRSTLYFNPGNQVYDFRLGLNYTSNRNILTTGFEARKSEERFLGFRWNLNKKWSVSSLFSEGKNITDSEFFNNRDYEIRYLRAEPKLTYQYNSNFRITGAYNMKIARNQIGSNEEIKYHDLSTELTYNNAAKTFVRSKVSFIMVDYLGDADTPVGYAILQGLQDGLNYRWNVFFDRKLSRNLILSLNYEGRKSGDNKIIHVGGASIKATF